MCPPVVIEQNKPGHSPWPADDRIRHAGRPWTTLSPSRSSSDVLTSSPSAKYDASASQASVGHAWMVPG